MNKIMKFGLMATVVMSLVFIGLYAADDKTNKTEGVTHISQQELAVLSKDPNTVLIDIRTQGEVNNGAIPGSIHLSITRIVQDTSLLDEYKGKDLVFYCHTGVRVKRLTDYLQATNHQSKENLHHLKGDWNGWAKSGKPVK